MKECKCSKILPCYRDGYGVWHYSDDTHDKVYELNKQMCDLGKTLSNPLGILSEEAIQEIAKALEITRKPKDIMEEKKTKKMTKAEAFEWLKGKKVRVCGRETSQKVQSKLFACGVQWMSGSTDFCDYGNYYVINSLGRLGFCDDMSSFWKNLSNEEISADDILSIEIEEECAKDDEDPYFGGRIKDLQEMLEHDEVLIITKTNFLTMTK
jgi:hypothetical protein